MRCSKVRTLLVAYQDGELAPSASHLVTQHLHHCKHCEEYNEQLFLTQVPIPEGPTVEQTIRMHVALDKAIDEAWNTPRTLEPKERRTSMRTWPVAIALLALASLGLWSSESQTSHTDIQPNATAGVITPDKHWF